MAASSGQMQARHYGFRAEEIVWETEMNEELLFDREIVKLEPEDDVWRVRFSCGHETLFVIKPALTAYSCAQCVNEYLEQIRNEKPS